MRAHVCVKKVVLVLLLLNAAIALAYLSDSAVHGPPPDYSSPTLPPRGASYADPVFNSGNAPAEWIRRISDAVSTPRVDGVPGNLPWITHEYSSTSPFNSDKTRVLLIHVAYFALYDTNGNLIRQLPNVCASCAPRWSRRDPAVFFYVSNRQVVAYNATADTHTPLGPQLPYDTVISKGEDDICFDGDHLVGFGQRAGTYYLYAFSIASGGVIAEAPIGNATEFANIDSAEIAPNDIVVVSYGATDQLNAKAPKKGIWSFTLAFVPLQQISTASGHHDIGMDVDGSPILVMTNSASYFALPGCSNGIEKIRILDPEVRSCLLPLAWTLAVHVSLPDQAGWAIVSTHAPGDPMYGAMSRKEELFPSLAYSGTWNGESNSGYSKGRALWSTSNLARVSYFFYGTQVQWISRTGRSGGMANVTVDGQTTTVDLYSPHTAMQSVVYSRGNLPLGFHNMKIEVLERKNRRSSGYRVWLDAIQDDTPWRAYTNEVLMVRLDGSQTRRLLHHRSRPFTTYNYQPRVSASRDGTRLLFASNYGTPTNAYTNYADAYVMGVDPQATMNFSAAPMANRVPALPDAPLSPADRTRINQYLYPKR